jgi:hypothetical protein
MNLLFTLGAGMVLIAFLRVLPDIVRLKRQQGM